MDNETMKSIIVELRNQNMTFQKIADTLSGEYGVVRSRQAVHNMYKTVIKEMEGNMDEGEIVLISDVVNLSALGYFMTEIVDLLKKDDSKVSYYKVRDILKKHPERVRDAENEMRANLGEAMGNSNYYKELIGVIKYKGWEPKDSGLKKFIMDIYEMEIKECIADKLNSALNFTDDRMEVMGLRDRLKHIDVDI